MTAKGMIGVVLQVYSSDGAGSPSMVEVSLECACFFSDGPTSQWRPCSVARISNLSRALCSFPEHQGFVRNSLVITRQDLENYKITTAGHLPNSWYPSCVL